MLHIAFVEPEFAKYRAEELNKLKTLLNDNKYFPTTLIYSDITTNPITLKVKILERFITNLNSRFNLSCRLTEGIPHSRQRTIPELNSLLDTLRNNRIRLNNIEKEIPEANDPCTILKLKCALIIEMLVFSTERFTISEIENNIQAAKESVTKGIVYSENLDREILLGLLRLRKSKSLEDDFVGLNREDFCCEAVAVYNRMYELFRPDNSGGPFLSEKLKPLLNSVANKCSDDIVMKYEKDVDAIYGKLKRSLTGFSITVVERIVNDKVLINLIKCLCNKLLEIIPTNAHKEKINQNLLLYCRMLIASKLLVNAKIIAKSDDRIDIVRAKVFHKHLTETLINYFVTKEDLITSFANEYSGDRSLETLIRDFFVQESRHIAYYEQAMSNTPLPEEYFEIYNQTGEVKSAIRQYTDPNNYKRAIYGTNQHFESHIDLYIFTRMAHAVQ